MNDILQNFENTFRDGRQRPIDIDVLFGALYRLATMVKSNRDPRALICDLLDEAAVDLGDDTDVQ